MTSRICWIFPSTWPLPPWYWPKPPRLGWQPERGQHLVSLLVSQVFGPDLVQYKIPCFHAYLNVFFIFYFWGIITWRCTVCIKYFSGLTNIFSVSIYIFSSQWLKVKHAPHQASPFPTNFFSRQYIIDNHPSIHQWSENTLMFS